MTTETLIKPERLAKVEVLAKGNHSPNDDGAMCVMEAVAYVTGEPWSDHPKCTCPVITALMISWNDGLPDSERGMLLPLIPKLVGTRGSKALERRRSLMAADWLIRTHTPAWLRLAGLNDQALMIEGLPEITDTAQYPSLRGPLEVVRLDASRARAAAWAAALDAAWAAALDAAWAAAVDAAVDAAAAKLKPTKDALQQSAYQLVIRMCEATDQ